MKNVLAPQWYLPGSHYRLIPSERSWFLQHLFPRLIYSTSSQRCDRTFHLCYYLAIVSSLMFRWGGLHTLVLKSHVYWYCVKIQPPRCLALTWTCAPCLQRESIVVACIRFPKWRRPLEMEAFYFYVIFSESVPI